MHPLPYAKTRVIHLSGNDADIGSGHYNQIGPDCGQGVQVFLNQFILNLMENPNTQDFKHLIKSKIGSSVFRFVLRSLKKNIPPHFHRRIEALCSSGNLSQREFLRATLAADLFPVLNSIALKMDSGRFVKPRFPKIFGCSSFLVKAPNFLIGRNLDFPGVGYWDRYQVIQCVRREKNYQYISLTTAGNPFGGITGINEHKIYVALHQHYGKNVHFSGELPFVTGERILEKSTSLEDAKKILVNSQTATSWAFVVADGKTGSAFICEKTPRSIGFRKFEGDIPLCHTNKFLTPECIASEYAVSERMNWDTHSRRKRMEHLLTGSEVNIEKAISVISDHFDPYLKTEAVAGRTISAAHNIQSLVLDMDNFSLYLAEGSSPVQIRGYRKYNLGEIFGGASGWTEEVLTPPVHENKNLATAREAYSLSFIQSMNQEYREALKNLRRSLEFSENAFLRLIEAQLLLKLFQFTDAVKVLDDARLRLYNKCKKESKIPLPPEYFEIILWQARTYRLLNQDEKAHDIESLIRGNSELKDEFIRREIEDPGPYSKFQLRQFTPAYSLFIPH